jgi:hypothetical protein
MGTSWFMTPPPRLLSFLVAPAVHISSRTPAKADNSIEQLPN